MRQSWAVFLCASFGLCCAHSCGHSARRTGRVAAVPRHGYPLLAKKGGKKGKKSGGKPKSSGFAWASSFQLQPFQSTLLRQLAESAAQAYEQRTGSPLHPALSGASDVPKALWSAPVACMIIGAKPASDDGAESQRDCQAEAEVLYANCAALEVGIGRITICGKILFCLTHEVAS